MGDVIDAAIRGRRLIKRFHTQEHYDIRLRLGCQDDWVALGGLFYALRDSDLDGKGAALLHIINTAFSLGYEAGKGEATL